VFAEIRCFVSLHKIAQRANFIVVNFSCADRNQHIADFKMKTVTKVTIDEMNVCSETDKKEFVQQ